MKKEISNKYLQNLIVEESIILLEEEREKLLKRVYEKIRAQVGKEDDGAEVTEAE